jgi:hypothetical protein
MNSCFQHGHAPTLHIHILSSTLALRKAVAFSWSTVKQMCNSLKRHQLHSHSCIVGRCLRLRLSLDISVAPTF